MIDHAPEIRAQQQAARENEEMKEMEKRAAPLLWVMFMAVLVLSLGYAADGAQAHIQHVDEMTANSDAFVQCLNGKAISIGGGILRCEVRKYDLVAGVQP